MFRLRMIKGTTEGQLYPVDGEIVIGRSAEVDIQLLDQGISRRHCCLIEGDAGEMLLVDLGSKNGVEVSGERIDKTTLNVGDIFSVGSASFVLETGEADVDELDQIKLMSGPAAVITVRDGAAICEDPLHHEAVKSSWDFCPACGAEIRSQ